MVSSFCYKEKQTSSKQASRMLELEKLFSKYLETNQKIWKLCRKRRKMNFMKVESEKVSVPRFLTMFEKFSPTEKLKIAEKINQKTFAEQWNALDAELPDVEVSDEEIMKELRAVRYGKKSNR